MRAGASVRLTPVDFRRLAALLRYPDNVLTHPPLLRDVWGPTHLNQSHYLRVYMAHLRQKLEADPARPRSRKSASVIASSPNDSPRRVVARSLSIRTTTAPSRGE
jgi:DNA-binding response OmpR family regulator